MRSRNFQNDGVVSSSGSQAMRTRSVTPGSLRSRATSKATRWLLPQPRADGEQMMFDVAQHAVAKFSLPGLGERLPLDEDRLQYLGVGAVGTESGNERAG